MYGLGHVNIEWPLGHIGRNVWEIVKNSDLKTGGDLEVIFKEMKIRDTKLDEIGGKVALVGKGWAGMLFKGNNCSSLEDVLWWWWW